MDWVEGTEDIALHCEDIKLISNINILGTDEASNSSRSRSRRNVQILRKTLGDFPKISGNPSETHARC